MKSKRPYRYTDTLDPSFIHSLYFDQGLSQREMAQRLKIGHGTICNLFKRLGIRTRSRSEQRHYKNALVLDAISADKSYAEGTPIKDITEWTGLDPLSVRCYLVDKGLKIRGPVESRMIVEKQQREACEERKKAGVTEATFYLRGGEKLVVKYDEEGRELDEK